MNHSEAFLPYYNTYMRVDIDPAFPLLSEIFRRYELSHEQQLWATFLYTAFYHIGSVFLVMQEFPDYEKVDLVRFSRWLHKFDNPRVLYQTDRKYWMRCRDNPGRFQMEDLIASYFRVMQHPRPQAEFLVGATTAGEVFRRIEQVNRIGRHSAVAYVETLIRCVGYKLEIEPDLYSDIAEQESHQGFGYANYGDNYRGAISSTEATAIVDRLMPLLCKRYPDIPVDAFYMETVGCAFCKLVEGRLYPGYYLDRQADEINTVAALPLSCGVHWETLWQMRDEVFPAKYLSRTGVRKEWKKHYQRTGELVNLL
jgi:hypothetical protein